MSVHLSKRRAMIAAAKQTISAQGGGQSSGWSRIDYGVRDKKIGPFTLHETYVRASKR